jgi:hypothetical protein
MKLRVSRLNLLFLLLCAGLPAALHAQTYSIDWFKVSGGGGTSTGGVYSVSGTIGQHDAGGPLTGGSYSLTGGFWALFAVQSPGAPVLHIFISTTNTAVITWIAPSTGYSLQQNTNLVANSWAPVTNHVDTVGSDNQVIISPPDGNRFFRLSKP